MESSYMSKLPPGSAIRRCEAEICDINTNKLYRDPAGRSYTACTPRHAETAWELAHQVFGKLAA